MTSYFEIGGHIVESNITSIPSPHSRLSAVVRPERGRNSTKSESVRSAANETGESVQFAPYTPLGSHPLGWLVGQVLLKGVRDYSSWRSNRQTEELDIL